MGCLQLSALGIMGRPKLQKELKLFMCNANISTAARRTAILLILISVLCICVIIYLLLSYIGYRDFGLILSGVIFGFYSNIFYFWNRETRAKI